MDAQGHSVVYPEPSEDVEPTKAEFPLSSGYFLRSLDRLPKSSDNRPWNGMTEPFADWYEYTFGGLTRGLVFSSRARKQI
jgi:hypothetical protein